VKPDFGVFLRADFLTITSQQLQPKFGDLVICNPPFNRDTKIKGRRLVPELFFDRAVELWGSTLAMVLICPMGFRLNQRKKSTRWRKLRISPQITSIVSLPLDIFEGVLFHSEVLMFGVHGLPAHSFLPLNAVE